MSLFRDLLINKKKRKYYCEVEYLESTGTQWINTGYNINTTTDEVTAYFQLITTEKYSWLMGEHDNGARFGIGSGDGTNLRNIAYGASTYKVNDTEVYNSQHYFNANSNGVYVNSTLVHAFESFSSTSTIYLFNLNISGGGNGASGRIWRYTHKRNGVLIRDLIPVLDWNYTPCMYDKISGQLFYNQGTDTFTYGREIHYVDYIESTGTQFIDTGVKLTNNHSVELDYQLTQASQSRAGLYGNLATARYGTLLSPSNQYLEFGYGTSNLWYQKGLPDTNRHVIKQVKNNIYFDGSLLTSFTYSTFSITNTAPLGSFGYTNYTPAKAKYYGSKWWYNDDLIRDYKSAIDENGVAFWFDRVTHTIYDNAGTDAFLYPARETEYLEVTDLGATVNQRPCIDLGIKYKSSMSIKGKYTRTEQGDSGSVLPLSNNTTNPLIYFPALDAGQKVDRFVWRRTGYTEQRKDKTFSAYPVTTEFKLDAVNDVLYIDGASAKTGMIAGMGGYSSPYESYSNLYMLSIAGNYGGLGKVYYLKLYDTTQTYRDLVPAWKDGSLGMYDKQNDVLYTISGSGTVVLGKIVESEWE